MTEIDSGAPATTAPGTEDPVVSIDVDTDPGAAAPSPGPGLWLRWFRAVTVGECLGFLMPATVGALTAHTADAVSVALLVLAGAAEGAVLGWFQARVLRRALPGLPVARWTVATAAAAALAWAIGMTFGTQGDRLAGMPVAALVPLAAGGGLVLLFSIGVAQWAVLRARVHGAGRWIWGTALAWTVALVAFMAVTMPLWQPGQGTVLIALVGVLGGLVMAATVAALTGWLAVRVTRPGDRK